mgnify:CR=1 FL=1
MADEQRVVWVSVAATRALPRAQPKGVTFTAEGIGKRLAQAAVAAKVNGTVVAAFEEGVLERFSQTLKECRSPLRRAQVLAKIIAAAAA